MSRPLHLRPLLVAALLAAASTAPSACRRDEADPARAALDVDSVRRVLAAATPAHVDSVFAPDEEVRRFKAAVRDSTDTLRQAAPSRDALVRALATAVARNDTARLRALAIDLREFAWLYYPTSRFAHDPYFLKPDVLWLQLTANSDHDGGVLLRKYGGRPMRVAAATCPGAARREGRNLLWEGCRLRLEGDSVPRQFFGTILERDGRFKLVSLANKL
ncbi:MAG: hypothetical protein HYX65_04255 [Gemmatimonadetes bacterium]|nr:hypothetical protein [Gemmatimonadota bacterium]